MISGCVSHKNEGMISVLILSGKNNHEWQKTTPFIKLIFEENGGFKVDITERPDTLTATDLDHYNVIVSNWNAFPETSRQWGEETEKAIISFITEGGGFVSIHASSATHYDWNEYQEIVGATWGKNTRHGIISPFEVKIVDNSHPVTSGMANFWTTDELWVEMDKKPGNQVLCSAYAPKANNGSDQEEPVIICRDFGKGHCFYNVLGHDVAAMKNTGFKTLLLRGTEWAARGIVTIPVPEELMVKTISFKNSFDWKTEHNSLALVNQGKIIWQVNFDKKEGKPYIHPLAMSDGTVLTWLRPKDHIWHRALWFSWKLINGVNYWEEDVKTGQSDGTTEILKTEVIKHPDYSAEILFDLAYHPPQGKTVLTEKRSVHFSCPDENGNYFLDWSAQFTAGEQPVILDRTPLIGEQGGQSYGGYAGFSIRMSPDLWDVRLLNSLKEDVSLHGKKASWLEIKAKSITGKDIQLIIMSHHGNINYPEPWWISNEPAIPFYYFSPAPLFYKAAGIEAGQTLHLNYRVMVQNVKLSEEQIDKIYETYSAKE